MKLEVINTLKGVRAPVGASALRQWLIEELKRHKRTDKCHIEVAWVGKAKMAALNKRYRNQNKPTDVLSFPVELEQIHGGERVDTPLGSIVLCLPVISEQAKNAKVSLRTEIEKMVRHSLRHLIGIHHRSH